ncbi:MAG: Lrp/AsnC family transcriptional regulator [Candidatus Diapherotrites archaeon]|nr:Lrp/AsnC family transcriptional regulator [Candidatus Diapherotrites archaeon]
MTEMKVLKSIVSGARKSIADIARETKLTRQTVYRTLKNLEADGTIQEFTTTVRPSRLNLELKCYMLIHTSAQGDYTELEAAVASIPEVSQMHYILGRYDVIIEACLRNKNELRSLIQKIEKVKQVEKSETFLVVDTMKYKPNDPALFVLDKELQ